MLSFSIRFFFLNKNGKGNDCINGKNNNVIHFAIISISTINRMYTLNRKNSLLKLLVYISSVHLIRRCLDSNISTYKVWWHLCKPPTFMSESKAWRKIIFGWENPTIRHNLCLTSCKTKNKDSTQKLKDNRVWQPLL